MDISQNIIPNQEFVFTTIWEGSSSITFNPPLKIDAYLIKDNDTEQVNVNFDFGLSYDFGLYPFYLTNYVGDWMDRTKKIVEFELFHSFISGCNLDPNYSTLNWALYGNLAHRVIFVEKYEFSGGEDIEKWCYNSKLIKVEI